MHTTLLFLVSVSLLLPPSACCCWAEAPRIAGATPEPASPPQPAPEPKSKCACCEEHGDLPASPRESAGTRVPAKKEHAPTCPVVRKLDRVRVVSPAAVIDVDELSAAVATVAVPIAFARSGQAAFLPRWPGGPPRHLLFSVLLI